MQWQLNQGERGLSLAASIGQARWGWGREDAMPHSGAPHVPVPPMHL